MSSKKFLVIFNRQSAGNQLGGGQTTLATKTQAEERHRKFGTEPVKALGPLEQAELIELETENATAAAVAARVYLGAQENEGELSVIETANIEKKAAR